MPEYNFSLHSDRLAYALTLPSLGYRAGFLLSARHHYGEAARQQIIDAMAEMKRNGTVTQLT